MLIDSTPIPDAAPETPVETAREKKNRLKRQRYATDKDYREKIQKASREVGRKTRLDPEKAEIRRQQVKECQQRRRADPEKREKINQQTRESSQRRMLDPSKRAAANAGVRRSVKKRLEIDPLFAATHTLRTLVRQAIQRGATTKTSKTAQLLGCSPAKAVQHLLTTRPGATKVKGFQIDHIVPVAAFDHDKPGWGNVANHFSNLQLLTPAENKSKSDSMPEHIPEHVRPWLKEKYQIACTETNSGI